ncbi:MAG: DUF1592 domain-containing protein [Myxococcaceae bacterium]
MRPFATCAALLLSACSGFFDATSGADGVVDPGPTYLRRLTRAEYGAAASALLRIDQGTVATAVSQLPEDSHFDGFDNLARVQSISMLHGTAYLGAAQSLVDAFLASAANRSAVVGCNPSDAACLAGFVERFGRRAFRRPLEPDEAADLVSVAQAETDRWQGVGVAIGAMLQSASFLFRPEVGVRDFTRPGLRRLTGYEFATRLSFFVLGAPPDDFLLDAAGAGDLDTVEGIEQATRAMLTDPRARPAMQRFAVQWFRVRELDVVERDVSAFPGFTPALRGAMREEFVRLMDEYLWAADRPFTEVFTADHTFVDPPLAALYGVSPPNPSGFGRLSFATLPDRGGLITLPALLTVSVPTNNTSVIHRGKFIRDAVLCDPLPSPPPNVPMLQVQAGETPEQANARHTSDPACSGCHRLLDPIGRGLERYDAIGRVRASYPSGAPIPLEGVVEGFENSDFEGGAGLGRLAVASGAADTCSVKKMFRWALGRSTQEPGANDANAIASIARRAGDAGRTFEALVLALVTNDTFRYRRDPDAP